MKQSSVFFILSLLLAGCQIFTSRETREVSEGLFGMSSDSSEEANAFYSSVTETIEAEFSDDEIKLLNYVLSDQEVIVAYQAVLAESTSENRLRLSKLIHGKGASDIFKRFASDTFQEAWTQNSAAMLLAIEKDVDCIETVFDITSSIDGDGMK